MFSKFSSVLHQAVEAFASGGSQQQEFTGHWKAITNYFIDNKDHKMCIEHTPLPHHLDCMFMKLQEEDGTDKTGPGMEYVLQHKILETLSTLARTDTPPGMKQEVLLFFTKLLSRLQHPLLPHMHVHKPVQRLVRLCGEQRAGPTETEEIQFLCTLCAKLKAQPHLINFFIESSTSSSLFNGVSSSTVTTQPSPTKSQAVFPLVTSLLSLMESPDARVAVKSCEGLMLICSLPESSCSQSIVQHTQLAKRLASQMSSLYKAIPKVLNCQDVESAQAKWGLDVHVSREDDLHFPGKQQLLALLSWLDYCDELVSMATPQVAKSVSVAIREQFLTGCLKDAVLQTAESGAITATCLLTRCLYCVHSKPLVSEFVHFVLGEGNKTEALTRESSPIAGNTAENMYHRLLERCNHLSDEMSIVTLKLFDTLLLKSDSFIFETLVLTNVTSGKFKKDVTNTEMENVPKASVVVDEQVVDNKGDKAEPAETTDNSVVCNGVVESPAQDTEGGEGDGLSTPTTSTSPQHRDDTQAASVHRVVNSFLSLVPAEVRSSTEVGDTGYDTYLRDAHLQYSNSCQMCKEFSWRTQGDCHVADVNTTHSFYEGDFLKLIFDRLSKALDQSYEVNLQLTSVLSKLCLLPHPVLHEYLLDPTLNLTDNCRSLFTILTKTCTDMRKRVQSIHNVKTKLHQVRSQLNIFCADLKSSYGKSLCIEDGDLLAGVIIIEEFCKELAAIAFVKHHTL